MVHSIVATLKIKPGAEDAFEAIARKLVAAVNANEGGCMLYTLNKGDDPLTYVFMERYRDEAAVEAHRATGHYRTYGKEMGAHLDGAPVILRMQEVA
ncbi:MAG: putative quinol monooxygenase [bacterium]|jgi:quinol monooxygenase YgiN